VRHPLSGGHILTDKKRTAFLLNAQCYKKVDTFCSKTAKKQHGGFYLPQNDDGKTAPLPQNDEYPFFRITIKIYGKLSANRWFDFCVCKPPLAALTIGRQVPAIIPQNRE
jgi:hypothetical protein